MYISFIVVFVELMYYLMFRPNLLYRRLQCIVLVGSQSKRGNATFIELGYYYIFIEHNVILTVGAFR